MWRPEGAKHSSMCADELMGGRTDSEGDQSFIMPPICQNEASPTLSYRLLKEHTGCKKNTSASCLPNLKTI